MSRTRLNKSEPVVLKVGSSSLTAASGGLDPESLEVVVAQECAIYGSGSSHGLGDIRSGRGRLSTIGTCRPTRDLVSLQVAASVGQGLLMERYVSEFR